MEEHECEGLEEGHKWRKARRLRHQWLNEGRGGGKNTLGGYEMGMEEYKPNFISD